MYIKEENGKVIIYEVILDSEELEKIRKQIIYKYGEVTQHCSKRDTRPIQGEQYYDTYMIEAVNSEYVGKHDTCDFYGTIYDIYINTYKKYKYPKLAIYINQFLKGDFSNLPKLKEFIKPKKIYRINDDNRESILELSPYRDYIKRVIGCIKLEVIREKQITSISDLLELIEGVDDKKLNKIYNNITQKLDNDSKKLSFLMEENND